MTTREIVALLSNFEKRLATIADQATETRAQAQHTLERINRLVQEVEQLKFRIISTADTGEHAPLRPSEAD